MKLRTRLQLLIAEIALAEATYKRHNAEHVGTRTGKPEISSRGEYTLIICNVCNSILAWGYKARAVDKAGDSVDNSGR